MKIEILVGIFALIIAIWQLFLQRKEQIRNSRINSLIYISSLLEKRIALYASIIEEKKRKKENFKGHSNRIHNDLNPLLKQTQDELISIISKNETIEYIDNIKEALKNKK